MPGDRASAPAPGFPRRLPFLFPAREPAGPRGGGPHWSSPPCRKSGWFRLVCLFSWRNFESQANTRLLTSLLPWPTFTARQQPRVARRHLSLPAVSLPPPPSPHYPGSAESRARVGRIIKPEAPRQLR